MGDPVAVPDWLTDPEDRARWLTVSDRDRSDWAAAHGRAVAGGISAAAAEAAGKDRERVQALEMALASKIADVNAGWDSRPLAPARHTWMIWAGAAALGFLVLRRGRPARLARKVRK